MKKCFAIVEYKNGKINLEKFTLTGGLSFSMEEAEGWIKERSGVVKVKCFSDEKKCKDVFFFIGGKC